jgi:hypothetical protein
MPWVRERVSLMRLVVMIAYILFGLWSSTATVFSCHLRCLRLSETWFSLSPSSSVLPTILVDLIPTSNNMPSLEDHHIAGQKTAIKTETKKQKAKTINSQDSQVVTDLTTDWPASGLSMAERTGSPVFHILWSIARELVTIRSIYLR